MNIGILVWGHLRIIRQANFPWVVLVKSLRSKDGTTHSTHYIAKGPWINWKKCSLALVLLGSMFASQLGVMQGYACISLRRPCVHVYTCDDGFFSSFWFCTTIPEVKVELVVASTRVFSFSKNFEANHNFLRYSLSQGRQHYSRIIRNLERE